MTHRGIVIAKNGAVAASQPLAVSAGLNVLANGGNAIEAALAVSGVLCVIEPHNSHLGGDGFVMYYDGMTQQVTAFNASGAAPQQATLEAYRDGIPVRGVRAATVPGLVHLWSELHQRYATRPLTDLFQTAIRYAADGYPVGPRVAGVCQAQASLFAAHPFLSQLGLSPQVTVGDVVTQPELAETLTRIADEGPQTFYKGDLAKQIVAGSEGHFTAEDFRAHQTRVLSPLAVRYRDRTVYGQPPPSQGLIVMQELLLANGVSLAKMSEVERLHFMVEAKKLAFADRNAYLGDPESVTVPVEVLLSEPYIAARRARIDPNRAMPEYPAGNVNMGSDTTYFLIADGQGNAVSWIQSIFHGFGSAYVVPGTGILLNNRLTGFSLNPASPNVLVPGKRPAHTLNAWLATREDGTLAHVGGTPGGHVQVQTNFQLIANLIDLGDDPQTAIERPRWQHLTAAGAVGESDGGGVLEIEGRMGDAVVAALRDKGHEVRVIGNWAHGSAAQVLSVLPNGVYSVGSDPRCDGHAAGL